MTKKRLSAAREHEVAVQILHQQAAAMKASMDGMAILDREGLYIYVNDAHARIYGYAAPEELVGQNYRDLYEAGERRRFEEVLMPTFWRSGAWRGESVGKRRDGTLFPQELSLTRVDDENGEASGMVCVVRDITERKRAESEHARLLELEKSARAEAEAASRAKDEFLAVVSHELRTPMTAILGWTWLLRSGDVAPEELGRALEVIERNMKLQAQIIEDLLDVSSIITGKLHLQARPVQIGAVLRAAVDTVRSSADLKRISIDTRVEDGLTVSADAHRLQQVFWNLLSNAVKFNHEGGSVRVSVGLEGGCASVTIEDDGQGIEPALLPEIFDPFRQGEDSLTRQYRGLGLGLAIVRHLVELHGGSVAASSPGQGKGSVFTVLLPAYGGPAAPVDPLHGTDRAVNVLSALPGSLDGIRVLLVDDEQDTLTMLSELLKHCGALVATALSARGGMTEIKRHKPQLLVCDLAMPDEDGYSFIRKIRAMGPEGKAIKALALSARARDEDRERAIANGFDQYLSKPVDPSDLVAALRSLSAK